VSFKYLGVFGRPGTEQKYHRLIAEWLANGRRMPVDPDTITVVEIIERFWTWPPLDPPNIEAYPPGGCFHPDDNAACISASPCW